MIKVRYKGRTYEVFNHAQQPLEFPRAGWYYWELGSDNLPVHATYNGPYTTRQDAESALRRLS